MSGRHQPQRTPCFDYPADLDMPARAAAALERERSLAALGRILGRTVELNEHGGVTLREDEIATLNLTIPSDAPTPTSAWGITIHMNGSK